MNGFRLLQQRLRSEGWHVGWNHFCCTSCAWADVPDYFDAQYDDEGYLIRDINGEKICYEEVDLSKVLFNHSQDCEYDLYEDENECPKCLGEGWYRANTDDDCEGCDGRGYVVPDDLPEGMMKSEGFICYPPELQHESSFCFDGSKEGVKNLKSILSIIEECGCSYHWSGKGDERISISWDNEASPL